MNKTINREIDQKNIKNDILLTPLILIGQNHPYMTIYKHHKVNFLIYYYHARSCVTKPTQTYKKKGSTTSPSFHIVTFSIHSLARVLHSPYPPTVQVITRTLYTSTKTFNMGLLKSYCKNRSNYG